MCMENSNILLSGSGRSHWLALALFLAATFLVAGISTLFTVPSIPTWYAQLTKPSFNPPNEVFGPAWTLLYFLMAIAAWLVWKQPISQLRSQALLLFWVQLGLNFAWSLLFFRAHLIAFALVDILLLWVMIALTGIRFFRLKKSAGWMFLPYFAWVSFASILNLAIWRLN